MTERQTCTTRNLRLDHLEKDAFVGSQRPRLSWELDHSCAVRGGVEIELTIGADSSVATRAEPGQILVSWPFEPLRSRTRGTLRIRATCPGGANEWSEPLRFETTLLAADDWVAELIRPGVTGSIGDPAPTLSHGFELPRETAIARARLYVTAHGIYEARINGRRVGQEYLSPGWTAYKSRLRFQTYDVTELVGSGLRNQIDVTVGNGWFRGRLGWDGSRAHYGDALGVLAQLEVEFGDGRRAIWASGPSWTSQSSSTVADDLYDGETVDYTGVPSMAEPVVVGPDIRSHLFPADSPPVRILERLQPLSVVATIGGAILVDFGQNFTGWVEAHVRGHRGQRIEIRQAEILIEERLGVETLRSAKATDVYVLDDADERTLSPRFTFHGFRYAEIRGMSIEQLQAIHGVVIGTALKRRGWFSCSDPRLNRLHDNIVRSARSNFVDIPMDCPQRDERLGWTGDIQLFAPAATFLFDMTSMLDSWLADLRHEQHSDGSVPSTVPDILRGRISPGSARTAGFSDAAVLVPHAVFVASGDADVIRRQWESAKRWLARALAETDDSGIWSGGFQWGDWLDPSAPPSDPARSMTPVNLVATAALARSLAVAVEVAGVIAPDDVAQLQTDRDRVAGALVERFVTPHGLVAGDSASAYAFLISLGVLTDAQQDFAGRRLVELLRARGFRASTGFLGTAALFDALDRVGAGSIAMRVLLTDRTPSWLAQVRLGATTVWERWDSLGDDGAVNDPGMTSFNHYALGAVADWMHRRLAGIEAASPGYRTLRIAPLLPIELDSAAARLDTDFGTVSIEWWRGGEGVHFDVFLPDGVDAHVEVDGAPPHLASGRHTFAVPDPSRPKPEYSAASVAEFLDDHRTAPRLVDVAVRLGIAADVDDAYHRLAPYVDLPISDLREHLAHPAFASGGPYVQRAFAAALANEESPHVRTY